MRLRAAAAALIVFAAIAAPADVRAQRVESIAENEALRIATEYVEAYSALDTGRMEQLASPDIRFADSTAPNGGIVREGRNAVIAGFTRLRDERGAISLGYAPETIYESQGWAVFSGPMNASFRTREPGTVYRWSANVTIIVHIENGEVVEHLDFADYAGARETIQNDAEPAR
jgi:hypothetical protein